MKSASVLGVLGVCGVASAGALLASCGGLGAPHGARRDLAALESACVGAPLDAARWERLADAIDDGGADGEELARALAMRRQAATLRAHDLRGDYALLERAMPRTEVRRLGAAMVEVVRVAAAGGLVPVTAIPSVAEGPAAARPVEPAVRSSEQSAAAAAAAATDSPASDSAHAASVRLEISNGNGVTGAAARLARALAADGAADGVKTVRLSNLKPYAVPYSRIEYLPPHAIQARALSRHLDLPLREHGLDPARADLRIVLGHDARRRPARRVE